MNSTKKKRRFFRPVFGLRALFILPAIVTVLCVWNQRARNQRAAVERLEEHGAQFYYDHQFDSHGKLVEDEKGNELRLLSLINFNRRNNRAVVREFTIDDLLVHKRHFVAQENPIDD